MINLIIDNQTEFTPLPSPTQFQNWVEAVLEETNITGKMLEVSLSLMEPLDIQALNNTYRNKQKPTNVLSFPQNTPDTLPVKLLGDVVICPQVILEESQKHLKPFEAHFAHITIHGILHLLGFDHETKEQQDEMEPLEIKIMQKLGYADPYA